MTPLPSRTRRAELPADFTRVFAAGLWPDGNGAIRPFFEGSGVLEQTKKKHRHGEAFMLMTYACKCGHRERIWNSRDGVTPFGMRCTSCGEVSLSHVDWHLDVYAPDHKLHVGQQFWRDGTPDEAAAIMRRRIERMKDQYPISCGAAQELIESARAGNSEFATGWPMLDRHPDPQPLLTTA